MLHDLLKLDISDFNVRKPPMTAGLIEQKIESFDLLESWWYQKLQDEELIKGYSWEDLVPKQEVYGDYLEHSKKISSRSWSMTSSVFTKNLRKMLLSGWPKCRRPSTTKGSRIQVYEFPSLKACRKHFSKRMGVSSLEW